mmetsp:Transcript_25598/g.59993  ORF Transcript_25598/g.59993 Transcript_25598/m.59993 type:complete len:201 (+) Transcript_25598:1621-2223(+)
MSLVFASEDATAPKDPKPKSMLSVSSPPPVSHRPMLRTFCAAGEAGGGGCCTETGATTASCTTFSTIGSGSGTGGAGGVGMGISMGVGAEAGSGAGSGAEAGWLPHAGIPVSSVGTGEAGAVSVGGCSTGVGDGGATISGSSTTGAGGADAGTGTGTGSFSAWIKCADPFVAQTFPLARGAANGAGTAGAVVADGNPGGG